MMWQLLFSAIALVFIIEGIMPFLFPDLWRNFLAKMVKQTNQTFRIMGFFSMVLGVVILFIVHHHLF